MSVSCRDSNQPSRQAFTSGSEIVGEDDPARNHERMKIFERGDHRSRQVQIDVDEGKAAVLKTARRFRKDTHMEVDVGIGREQLPDLDLCGVRSAEMRLDVSAFDPHSALQRFEHVEQVELGVAFLFADQAGAAALEDACFGEGAGHERSSTRADEEVQRGGIGEKQLRSRARVGDERTLALPAGRNGSNDGAAARGDGAEELAGEALLHDGCDELARPFERISSMHARANRLLSSGVRSG